MNAAKNKTTPAKVTRPVLRYHGGKWKMAPWIIANMPEHQIYVEPFGGGANVLLRKPRLAAELYNDLDGTIVGVFRVLQCPEKAEMLRRRLALTPFSRAELGSSYAEPIDDIDRAAKTIVRAYMGMGSDSATSLSSTGFRSRLSDARALPAQAWHSWPESVPAFVERRRGVVIENRDATEVMQRIDTSGTLFFVDPPYVGSTRSSKHGYRHEMTDPDHRALAVVLHALQGMVMLSGYPSALYDELYSGWQRMELEALTSSASRRTECLWFNEAAWSRRPQIELMAREVCA